MDGWLVVGLGNPGPGYAGHRHNLGAMVVGALAEDSGIRLRPHKAGALVAETRLEPPPADRTVLAVPTTYMNESGAPVAALLKYYSLAVERLVVVHDDLDIPFGQVRLKLGGGEGGHNGLRSVSKVLATRAYLRVRVGIGRPPGRMDPADYVLRNFSAAEREELKLVVVDGADATRLLLARGLLDAQQVVHSR
ncbi:MAG TPA: aminoacyl-tRNA hydrolase [Dermatophilaceae bacterium]|nr:aminoacyl-tRNA hydrolase [Dermatophilaceae bacterium]